MPKYVFCSKPENISGFLNVNFKKPEKISGFLNVNFKNRITFQFPLMSISKTNGTDGSKRIIISFSISFKTLKEKVYTIVPPIYFINKYI